MDHAAGIQYLCEVAMVNYSKQLHKETAEFNSDNLCLAGGVALNCNANYKVMTETEFKDIHFFPACGDDGISVGSALYVNHMIYGNPRVEYKTQDIAYLGTEYIHQPASDLKAFDYNATYVAEALAAGKIICLFQGRSELGPRALGNRSFICDPSNPEMKNILNARVKMREWFRPFAPVVLNERREEYFNMDFESPFMLYTVPCRKPHDIPSAVHIDSTARVQTLTHEHNPMLHELITEFDKITGCPVVMNTSLNIKGQPIVETPEDAMQLFMESETDLLIINDAMYFKDEPR